MTAVIDMQAARGRRGGSASAAAIERAERERKAIALRQQGFSFDEIASELGYVDRSGARKAVERGLSRWMRETDEEFRARELERTEMIIDRSWPLIDCEDPDLKALDRLIKIQEYRAKIMGLYGKRATPPDTYPGAPNRAAEDKGQKVNRWIELVHLMQAGVLESGYGSGIAAPGDDDEDEDADLESLSATSATGDAEAEDAEGDDALPEDMVWIDGRPVWRGRIDGRRVRGTWNDGKFVRSADEVSEDDAIDDRAPESARGDDGSPASIRAEALVINSDG